MHRLIFFCVVCPLSLFPSQAFSLPSTSIDIMHTSLEELMNIRITTLSKKPETLKEAPAAVFVLSHDDFRRSGAQNVAEVLRYVPGVEVARVDASRWAISIRGFNGRAANKLLVMIDGRSIYSSFFSGVLWEEKHLALEDVERIEVIRGPGGAIWGANAVNGVINIITKEANKTQGTLVDAGVGTEQRSALYVRHGWKNDKNSSGRIYFKALDHRNTGGEFENDDSSNVMTGFRIDHEFSQNNQVVLSGDWYSGKVGELETTEQPRGQRHSGQNVALQWNYEQSELLQHQILSYYDHTDLDTPTIDDRRDNYSVEYRLRTHHSNHDLVVGGGFRYTTDQVQTLPEGLITPEKENDTQTSVFIQDDIAFYEGKTHLILGLKLEENDYSGEEWQPNLRVSHEIMESLLWVSWSRALRIPTRLEKDINIPTLNGDRFTSESVDMYELGWRTRLAEKFLIDVAGFWGEYDDLLSLESDGIDNKISGNTKGIEVSANYEASDQWLLRLNYSSISMDLEADSDSADVTRARSIEELAPKNMFQLISYLDLTETLQLNTYLRYVDALDSVGSSEYTVVDISALWQVQKDTELRLTARNIGDGDHVEWDENAPIRDDYTFSIKVGL